ncbi:MAG: YkgJ family cysteine cluster protein [Beijerinckiaceae bacterium]
MTQAGGPRPAAPARECGDCTLCCKVFDVPVLDKPAGRWCQHCQPGQGCGIHATRPDFCRQFFCLWITQGWIGPEWKPNLSKMVLTISPLNGMLTVQVDPQQPAAWRREPYYSQLKRWSAAAMQRKEIILVFLGKHATVILPDSDVSLGEINAGDRIVPETELTPLGPRPAFKIIRAA